MNNIRKKTPDILDNLMGIEQENNKAIYTDIANSGIKIIKENNKTIREKTTFNLSEDIIQKLDDAWMKLRRKLKNEKKITKTSIVESALEIILRDFDAKNEMSDLYISFKNS